MMPKATKYSDEQIIAMRKRMWEGATEAMVSREFHASKEYVRLVKHNLIRAGLGVDVSHIRAQKISQKSFELSRQIEDCRLAGMSRRETADHLGVKLRSVNYHAKGRRFANGEKAHVSPALMDEIDHLYYDVGWVQAQIAAHFHLDQPRVSAILRRKETERRIQAEGDMLARLSQRED
jgi:predicted XRE-type DNA-binding protein